VIAAGYDPIEMRSGWLRPWDPARAIEFSPVANRHYVHHADLQFECGVGAGLEALAAGRAVSGDASVATWPGREPETVRAKLREVFSATEAWGPAAAIAAIRRAAPHDTVATVDSGAHRILLSQMWTCYEPRTLLQSTGLCTMGCALPLAIGHAVAEPKRPVIAFTGDAGLEMILGELATLRDHALPVLVVVFVDRSLALIELKQRRTGWVNLGVDFPGTDFVAVAEAMGGIGAMVETTEAVEREVEAAFARQKFTLLAIPIGRKSYDGRF